MDIVGVVVLALFHDPHVLDVLPAHTRGDEYPAMSDKGTESRSNSLEKVAATIEETPVKGTLAYGGEDTLPPPPTLTAEEEKRLWRKIDMRLMPILTLMYLCSFLDRGNIGMWPSGVRELILEQD